jgi:4a-hydroxytetrahydrobiopterin dehydratase
MPEHDDQEVLSRTDAQAAVADLGWRFLLGCLCLSVPVRSLAEASDLAVATAGLAFTDGHLRIDLRPDRVELSLQTRSVAAITERDVDLARLVSGVIADLGFVPSVPISSESARPVQMLEFAIDALDIGSIRPFWKAVLAYTDEPGRDRPTDALVDPAGQLPALWFQQMDSPRPQRNRIHFDVTVAHDEAEPRVAAAIAAGGQLVDGSHARSFWVLADAEGNEACVCTWMDRDGKGLGTGLTEDPGR